MRPGFERGVALGLVAGFELVDPGPVNTVTLGDMRGRLALSEQGGDNKTELRYGRASSTPRSSPMT